MTKTRMVAVAAGLIGLIALGACSGSEPDTNVEVNNLTVVNQTDVVNVVETEAPIANAAGPANASAAVPDAATSAQVQDDADATGLTSHVDRANQTEPAQ